ncbi:hypothetical protein V8E51_005491 [Hyaloscypha variabilis]
MSQWPSMQTFLSQQRKQGGKASSLNNAKGINPAVDACMTRSLLTKDRTVLESHTRLSKIMVAGQTTPHSLHLYSHPYGSLEIDDLVKYLADTVREFGLGQGVMGLSAWDPLSLSVNLELLFGDDLVLHFLMLRLLSSHSLIDIPRRAKAIYHIS